MLASLCEMFSYAETCITLKQFRTVNIFICTDTDDAIQSLKDVFLAQLLVMTPHTTAECNNSTQNIQTISKITNRICEELLQ